MVSIRGRYHTKACRCEYCAILSAEAGVQSVLGKEKGMITTRELISRAVLAPNNKVSERLKDSRIITVMVSKVLVPGVKNHTRAFFYIDGKRIARATAALILRNHT
jgi:hypothetical protein